MAGKTIADCTGSVYWCKRQLIVVGSLSDS